MARKALLIGSQTGGLEGVTNDIDSMERALGLWGFASVRCEAADATRAGILDAYQRLITEARDDDAIVVYYSGHGGFCRPREWRSGSRHEPPVQLIVPSDFDDSVEGDFRGIMAMELSELQASLTDRTKNVTVVLDCCHAAHMSREDELQPRVKALPRAVSYDIVMGHHETLLHRGAPRVDLPESNRWAVRIVACEPDKSAYEYFNGDGIRIGMMTEALTQALTEAHEAGLKVSWAGVAERVRQQVLAKMPAQRPDAEGPSQRLLFETTAADTVGTLPVIVSGDRARLSGAALLGVRVGDEFTVMPTDSSGPDPDTKLGDIVVEEIQTTTAVGPLRLRTPELGVPLGARAYRVKAAAPEMPVRLPDGDVRGLAQLVEMNPILRPAEPDETGVVEVRAEEGGLTIWDRYGAMHTPYPADRLGVVSVMKDLQRLAWANELRCLAADPANELETPVDVEFGLVREGQEEPLETSGSILYLNQRVYVRIRNRGSERVFVSLLNIGVSAKVTLLNKISPGGVPLDPGQEYTFGASGFKRVMQGSPLVWPQGLLRSQPRPETIVVLVMTEQQDLSALEGEGVGTNRVTLHGPRSQLERMIDQIGRGGLRDVVEEGPPMRFTVRTVDFELVPVPPPVSEDPEFQVDERPPQSMLLWSPKGTPPSTVAVRLTDLVVHRNRAFRSADIRLDAVVITRGPGRQPVYGAWTERFSNISDGHALPLERVLVYHGPVIDYLDLAVWVSRDTSGSLALSDLLEEKLTDNDVQLAMGQLGGLLVAAPQAAMAVAAMGAGAVVINAAYHLLTGIVGNSIGLYRTTMLAHEDFGVGRPESVCTIRAQDFSFTYLIEDVG
ncbi:caspase family protein [Allorhizocola rhizosphaerae]|uniref:caspase family protein n=1 Tax=Allorhizocola rhizosphaerae TaxID=1872709 RepID=UPI000E3C0EE1|nr:caspase family protein [Allorhizocola rhizosphaerae]